MIGYRQDIDGLRAIAVLSVVLYHAFPNIFKGGFIGVDIFFVISGYLISIIIFKDLDKGCFTFSKFYANRVRRIFPSLILVLVTAYFIGWFFLLPAEFKQLAKHIAGGVTFTSNLILLKESGYFDAVGQTKPLLHLWSLGIEEQFYILWPLLLLLSFKRKFIYISTALILFFISFYLNLMSANSDIVGGFYSPHTRFWELMAGSILAWLSTYKPNNLLGFRSQLFLIDIHHKKIFLDGISIIGTGLLLFGLIKINKNLIYPGYWAVIPVFGTYLIIAAGSNSILNRALLSSRILVWLGLISYPLYLWHWLLLSYAFIVVGDKISAPLRFTILIVSIILSWLTYRYVEKPMRFGKSANAKVIGLLMIMVVIGLIGSGTLLMNGLDNRLKESSRHILSYRYDAEKEYQFNKCFFPDLDKSWNVYDSFSVCPSKLDLNKGKMVIWGDSYAAHLLPGLNKVFGNEYNILQRTAGGCPPLFEFGLITNSGVKRCGENNKIIKDQLKSLDPDYVFLSARWDLYDLKNLRQTIVELKKIGVKKIILIGPSPVWREDLRKQLFRHNMLDFTNDLPNRLNSGLITEIADIDRKLKDFSIEVKLIYVSPLNEFCNVNGCLVRLGDTPESLTTWDNGHFTSASSEFLASRIKEKITTKDPKRNLYQ